MPPSLKKGIGGEKMVKTLKLALKSVISTVMTHIKIQDQFLLENVGYNNSFGRNVCNSEKITVFHSLK